ncbi:ATP-binding protein, partial [Actinomadura coerulea]|uniref:ATP-binding protein n=1 Tax=Actinomadura coerulea TaxID=46159 RepID=UPI003431B54A
MAPRSAYLYRVREIFHGELVDRQEELAELAAFCTASEGPGYVWWQGEAWAGKSALMASFVLAPPSRVRVVSFFVTARWAGRNDRVAFLDAVLPQLAEIAGEPLPDGLPDALRQDLFLRLVDEAARACARAGDRLVLLVDGLDEDRGVTTGPEAYSIAALLPARPDGFKVVVAGRPNPPVPSDVSEEHPLRDRGIVRPLSQSPKAKVIQNTAVRELKHLLGGSPAEQDLLGLVAAAGGGLSGPDLAALTGRAEWEIEEYLSAVSGRTFSNRASSWSPGDGPTLYVLAHEELQVMALQRLGATMLEGYRQKLHVWAQCYRQQQWPAESPEYLLLGYFPMLRAAGDLPRMIAWCLDSARHDRMLDLSGGDHTTLTEIRTTQETICAGDSPDLLAMCRLAITRDGLQQRNSNIPAALPTAWALLGNINRAESLARSITGPDEQARALTGLAKAVAQAGGVDRAKKLTVEAESLARSITDPDAQVVALTGLVEAVAQAGDLDRAASLARSITDPDAQASALTGLVEAVAHAGDLDRAASLARSITDPDAQASALTGLVEAVA